MNFSIQVAATILALANFGQGFTIENPTTSTYSTSDYEVQPTITIGGGYVASGGPSNLASGNCTFTTGTTNSWTIKTNNYTISASGCYNVTESNGTSTSLPRSNFSDTDPTAFTSTSQWCYIGDVNDGSASASNAGAAVYNAKDGNSDKWDEWAYCEGSEGVTTYQYVSIAGYSTTNSTHNEAGYPCANTWNFNNKTDGNGNDNTGGVVVGVSHSCLPFADYKPNTDGLDLSNVPDYEQKYWCFLEQYDGTVGYNPTQVDSSGYTAKTYEWGFCEDTTDPYTSAPTAAPSEAPTEATSTSAPTEATSSTSAPTATSAPTTETTSAPVTTSAPSTSSETTSAPVATTDAPATTGAPTPAPTPATGTDSPSSASGMAVPMLLATAVAALAL